MVKNPPANTGDEGDTGSIPGSGRSPGVGNGNPTLPVLPGESHGQRSLVGCSPWGCTVSDMTEHTIMLTIMTHILKDPSPYEVSSSHLLMLRDVTCITTTLSATLTTWNLPTLPTPTHSSVSLPVKLLEAALTVKLQTEAQTEFW